MNIPNGSSELLMTVSCSLVVLSDHDDAAELASLLGAAADRQWSRGDALRPTGKSKQPFTGFVIEIAPARERPEDQLWALIARLGEKSPKIASAIRDPRVRGAKIWLWSEAEEFRMEMSPELSRALADLGVFLAIDHYSVRPPSVDDR